MLHLAKEVMLFKEVFNRNLLVVFSLSPSSEKDKITTRTLKARMD